MISLLLCFCACLLRVGALSGVMGHNFSFFTSQDSNRFLELLEGEPQIGRPFLSPGMPSQQEKASGRASLHGPAGFLKQGEGNLP